MVGVQSNTRLTRCFTTLNCSIVYVYIVFVLFPVFWIALLLVFIMPIKVIVLPCVISSPNASIEMVTSSANPSQRPS